MFAALHRITFKIKVAIYTLILIILLLLSFGIYYKVRALQSYSTIEHQAASTSDISILLDQVTQSLRGIEDELRGLRKETCMNRTSQREECL